MSASTKVFAKTSNIKAGVHVFIRLLWHVLAVSFIYMSIEDGSIALAVLFFYLNSMTWSFLGYAGLAHEFFHKKVFSNSKLNTFLFRLCSYLTWSNPAYFVKTHVYHHMKTFADDDVEVKGDFRLDYKTLFWSLTIDFGLMARRLLYAVSNVLGYEFYATSEKKFRPIDASRREIVQAARAMLVCNILFYGVLFAVVGGFTTLAVFLAPFTATFLNRFLAFSQHEGLADMKEAGPLQHSRTILLPRVLAFFYANMNYHAEHHYKPSTPFYNLPAYHQYLLEKGKIQPVQFKEYVAKWL